MSKTFECKKCDRNCVITVDDKAHPWHCPYMGSGCDDIPNNWSEIKPRLPDTELVEALRLLSDTLPHIECKDSSQCNIITAIGEFIDKHKEKK